MWQGLATKERSHSFRGYFSRRERVEGTQHTGTHLSKTRVHVRAPPTAQPARSHRCPVGRPTARSSRSGAQTDTPLRTSEAHSRAVCQRNPARFTCLLQFTQKYLAKGIGLKEYAPGERQDSAPEEVTEWSGATLELLSQG